MIPGSARADQHAVDCLRANPVSRPTNGETLESAWRRLRDELIAECIATRPGTRPWAFFEFECPDVNWPLSEQGTVASRPRGAMLPCDQARYLAARGLLTEAEKEALGPVDATWPPTTEPERKP